jgi:hypothetical protein
LAKGGNVVLIVDEAQNLDNKVMENLRLLSNLETRKHKLIQIILSGQPELDIKLSRHELRQFAQRISLKRYVSQLDEKETYEYLQHRLKVAQYSREFPFTPEAKKLIWEYSRGVPRKINILCDNCFLIGYGMNIKKINGKVVREVLQDLTWNAQLDKEASLDVCSPENNNFKYVETNPLGRFRKLTATMVVAAILIFAGAAGGFFFTYSKKFQSPKLTNFLITIKDAVIKNDHHDNERENRINPTNYNLPKETIPKEIEKPQFIASKKSPEENGLRTYKIKPDGLKSDYNDKITEGNKAGVSVNSPENSLKPESLKEMTQATTEPIDSLPSNLRQGIHVTVPVTEKTADEIQESVQIPSEIKSKPPSSQDASDIGQNKSVTIPSSDLKRGEIQTPASKHTQIDTKPKPPDTLNNTEIEQTEPDASSIFSDKQATILSTIPFVNPIKETAHPEKDLSEATKDVYKEMTQPAPPMTDDNESATGADKKTVSLNATAAISETADSAGFDHSNLNARLKSFLNEYCRIYEQKDLDKLSNFFALNAVENGKPFKFWLNKYRQNFNRMDSLEYHIEIERYATQEETRLVKIDGLYHIKFKMADSKEWRKNSGQISMVLEADENSFHVKQLDY